MVYVLENPKESCYVFSEPTQLDETFTCQRTEIDLEVILRPKVDTLPFCAPIMGISVVI